MNRLRAAGAVTVLGLWPIAGHAAPGDATRLEYSRSERAAHCPDRDALKRAVTTRLGYDPFFPAARQAIVVEITDQDDRLNARMHLSDEKGLIVGSRELSDKLQQCDELVASLALAISIALDPSAALGDRPAPKEPGETTPETSPALEDPSVEPEPTRPAPGEPAKSPTPAASPVEAQKTLNLATRVSGFVAQGTAPSLAAGFRVGLGLRDRWLKIALEFVDQFPSQQMVSGGGSARVSMYGASLATCLAKEWLSGCALIEIGSLKSEGQDIPAPVVTNTIDATLGARFEIEPRLLDRLDLLLNADLLKSFTPTTLRLRGEEVWKTPFASLAVGAGLAWRFP